MSKIDPGKKVEDISFKAEYVENLACSSIFKGVHEVSNLEVECGKTAVESCESLVAGGK